MTDVLLDTSVLIDLERIDLGEYAGAEARVSAISIAELAFGLEATDPVERLARRQRYEAILQAFDIIPFGLDAATIYGTLAAMVRDAGRNPRPRRMDLQIAATAVTQRVPLLTRNPGDFASLERLLTVVAV